MEIELRKVNYKYKNKTIFRNLNIKIDSSSIIGVVGDNKSTFLSILDLVKKYDGDILIDNNLVNHNINLYRKNIALVSQNNSFFTNVVKYEFKFIAKYHHVRDSILDSRISDSLKMVTLDDSYLNRKIDTLSSSELFLFKLACNLFLNPKVILIDDGFNSLDEKTLKYVINLLKRLNKSKGRIIIIASNDVDFIYSFTKKVIVLKNQSIAIFDDVKKVFSDINFLNNNQVDIPYLVDFTYRVKKDKKVKLSYHTDILDLIKDVYKHV